MSESSVAGGSKIECILIGLFNLMFYAGLLLFAFSCGRAYERSTLTWKVDPETGVTRFSFRMGRMADD